MDFKSNSFKSIIIFYDVLILNFNMLYIFSVGTFLDIWCNPIQVS